jgi:hypothetical protein
MIRLRPDGFRVRQGNMENWPHPPSGDTVAILPRMGHYADAVVDALCRDTTVVNHSAPFSVVLAAVARGIAEGEADAGGLTTDGESGTLCSGCRREREASPPPPQPVDPSVPRLTEDALAQHARTRDRSRSPVRAEDPSAQGGR